MLKDSKFSSHLLHLSQLQTVNHKTLDEYRERLTTFEDSFWFGKPDAISAIECARRGWKCRGNDTIECVNCHAQLTAVLPSVLKIDQYRDSVEKIARALVESHQQYCVWKFMIIPESTVQLTEIYSNETINRFLNEAEDFLTRIQSIEITGSMNSVFNVQATDFDLLASSHLNDPRLLSAFKIVILYWKLKESTLVCEKCCRAISISFAKLTFDPILSHRSWCPILKNKQWKHRLDQIESILHRKSRQRLSEVSSNKSEQTDHILNDIVSTQELFHELISSKEYYRSCVQNNFDDNASATDIDQLNNKSIPT